MTWDMFEREILRIAICCAEGNVQLVADVLEMNRTTVSNKLREHKIEIKRPKRIYLREIKAARFMINEFENFKVQSVLASLERNNWVRTAAAADLGISLRNIRLIIQKLRSVGYDVKPSPLDPNRRKYDDSL